jgi:hypothetical protein
MIACLRLEAQLLRMQASVAADLFTGRRACGASVLPFIYMCRDRDLILPANRWRREAARLALRERKSLGRNTGTNACIRNRCPDPAVSGRSTAGTSPCDEVSDNSLCASAFFLAGWVDL